jgi:hypothetical protein
VVRDELALTLRAALVPIAVIRAQGGDISVARFAPSPNVSYAMFAGGGLAWLEREMKAGRYATRASIARHPAGSHGAFLSLERHSRDARRDPVTRGGAGDARRSGISSLGRDDGERSRRESRRDAAGAR